ncbi:hypothetical protein [Sphingomonas sp.]|uniref:hypothetical protein n=1 Tax=Sphingomonas sp. TaxID=28214 RepID=UPI003D6D10B3
MRPPSGYSSVELNSFFSAREWFNIVLSFTEILPPDKFLNHPIRSLIAESKPLQLDTAKKVGFRIPETIFTNNPAVMREFAMNVGQCIAKPVDTSITANPDNPEDTLILFTRDISASSIKDSESYQSTSPMILQERIDKKYELRAVVYGDAVRFIKIDSQRDERTRLDFRRKLSDSSMYSISQDEFSLGNKCIAYCRAMGLDSGVFDLAIPLTGDPVFFECNPNGQWGGMNTSAGGDIHQMAAQYVADRVCRA